MHRRLIPVALLVAVLLGACASSGDESVEAKAQHIEKQVFSPYCPDRLLADCTTRQSMELRREIRARLGDGDSEAEVLAWFESNHGSEFLAGPDIGMWVLTGAVLAVGALFTGLLVRRWSRGGGAPEEAGAPPADAWRARVRDEVRRDL